MDVETFQVFAEAVQAVVFSLAALVGGIWAIYRFRALREREKRDKELHEQATVSVQVRGEQLRLSGSDRLVVRLRATLRNTGERNTHLVAGSHPAFQLGRLPQPSDFVGRPHKNIPDLRFVLRAGATQEFVESFDVEEPGLYWGIFQVALDEREVEIAREAGQGFQGYWTGEDIFVVRPASKLRAGG